MAVWTSLNGCAIVVGAGGAIELLKPSARSAAYSGWQSCKGRRSDRAIETWKSIRSASGRLSVVKAGGAIELLKLVGVNFIAFARRLVEKAQEAIGLSKPQ